VAGSSSGAKNSSSVNFNTIHTVMQQNQKMSADVQGSLKVTAILVYNNTSTGLTK